MKQLRQQNRLQNYLDCTHSTLYAVHAVQIVYSYLTVHTVYVAQCAQNMKENTDIPKTGA